MTANATTTETATTDVHRALECVTEQRESVADRIDAFESFAARVRELPAGPSATTAGPVAQATPTVMTSRAAGTGPTTPDSCAIVRQTFLETIVPHTTVEIDGEESVVRALAAEFSRDIAVALTTNATWTAELKTAVIEAATTRRFEAERLQEALEAEAERLETLVADLDPIVAWLRSTAAESLQQYGFDELQAKHDRLEEFCEQLETGIEERQERLQEPVREAGDVPYRTLVESVYASFDARYPVLATLTRLCRICRECQRTVRDHLVRRA
ncbi:DUF7260 family protein [Halopiger xanaduensis]|uniref:DUF7260 domain-containing protein n=1 Tax=Halopiger xanaduensis (strain DSM 18323 / JCM 14033 / SH-6) TaxID=797210 RepID=F8D2Z1_HALXS|nr:OmpH family outer membrane protein [Halopiger xanaduensis]AEH36140.1 hypothetical protein Halxa_1508 [Halopiger xanaduensis SH-6]